MVSTILISTLESRDRFARIGRGHIRLKIKIPPAILDPALLSATTKLGLRCLARGGLQLVKFQKQIRMIL